MIVRAGVSAHFCAMYLLHVYEGVCVCVPVRACVSVFKCMRVYMCVPVCVLMCV